MVRRSIALLAALSLAALLAGCLDFEEQEVHLVYDAAQDRLDVQLVDRGVYVAEDLRLFAPSEPGFESAKKQLVGTASGHAIFAVFSDLWTYDLAELAKDETPLVAALAARIAVDEGDFFRAADGRLGAWQQLHVTGFTEFMEIADRLGRLKLVDAPSQERFLETFGIADRDSKAALAKAIFRKGALLERRGSAVVLKVPTSEEAARAWVAAGAAITPRPSEGTQPSQRPTRVLELERGGLKRETQPLKDAGVIVSSSAAGIELSFGDPRATEAVIRYAQNPGKYVDNLAPLLAELHRTIRTDVTAATLRASFAEFRRD